jgi:hypothetical protein
MISYAFNGSSPGTNAAIAYSLGTILLPPNCVKYPEPSGKRTFMFTVFSTQPAMLEFSWRPTAVDLMTSTKKKVRLNKGDMFRVFPGTSFRLKNHSKTTAAKISFTLIIP